MNTDLHNAGRAVDCRFLFGNGAAEDLLRKQVARDIQMARLSPAFRAYYQLRSFIPLPVRQLLQRGRSVTPRSDWYIPSELVGTLAAICKEAGEGGVPTIHPWPDDATFAFVPTHDVESAEGVRRIERIANLEEECGFRSSWNIVPHKYPVDRGLLRHLRGRGFEIGVHGYNHDGKLFASRSVFNRRVAPINTALHDFDAVGFRAPMVHRNLEWLQSLDIEYDASCFDIDPYQAMPGGIGSVWPFIAGRFVELSYTLPQDHTLFIALGQRDGRIWEEKLDFIAALGGMALFITHPDYLDSDARINAYRSLLEKARAMTGMWHALPKQIASWWRERDQSILHFTENTHWQIEGRAKSRGRAAALLIADESYEADAHVRTCAEAVTKTAAPMLKWHDLPRSALSARCPSVSAVR